MRRGSGSLFGEELGNLALVSVRSLGVQLSEFLKAKFNLDHCLEDIRFLYDFLGRFGGD